MTLPPLRSGTLLMGAHFRQIHGIALMHQPRSLPPLKSRLICESASSELPMVWSPEVTSGYKGLQETAELLHQFTALFLKLQPVWHVTPTPLIVLSQRSIPILQLICSLNHSPDPVLALVPKLSQFPWMQTAPASPCADTLRVECSTEVANLFMLVSF